MKRFHLLEKLAIAVLTIGMSGMLAVNATAAQSETAATGETQATAAAESIDSWMPNKKLQGLILANMQTDGVLPADATVADITQENIKNLTKIRNVFTGKYTNEGCVVTDNINTFCELLSSTPGVGSYSLEGLQYATNATEIALAFTAGYEGMVTRSDITDISPLAKLNKLADLNVEGNRITDISPIAPLANSGTLKNLTVTQNSIADFSSLTNPNLKLIEAQQMVVADPIYVDPAAGTASVSLDDYLKLPFGRDLASTIATSPNSNAVSGPGFFAIEESMAFPLGRAWVFWTPYETVGLGYSGLRTKL